MGGWVVVDLDANVGRDAKDLPNHDADCNVDRQSGCCKSIPANQQHPRHERTRKSKGSSEEVVRKSEKMMGGGGLLGVREQEEGDEKNCRLGPASVARS